jgi:hypothetical protein
VKPLADFPDIPNPSYQSGGKNVKAQVRTEFEAGYVQSRARHSRARKTFSLTWNYLREADFALLEAFFEANQGGMFTYSFLGTGNYRFSDDELNWTWNNYQTRQVKLNVEEV